MKAHPQSRALEGCLAPLLLALLLTADAHSRCAWAQTEPRYATVVETQGEPQQMRGEGDWGPLFPGMRLHELDRVRTPSGASVILAMIEGNRQTAQFKITENSELVLEKMSFNWEKGHPEVLLDLAVGSVLLHVGNLEENSSFEVRTPVSTSGVRGTGFLVSYEKKRKSSETAVYEGSVAVWVPGRGPGEPDESVSVVEAGTRVQVDEATGVREPTPLSAEEMKEGLRGVDQLKIPPAEKPSRVKSGPKRIRIDSSVREESPLKRLKPYLPSLALVLLGSLLVLSASASRSFVVFLLGCGLIAGGVWLFRSNHLELKQFYPLVKEAVVELLHRLPRF